MKKNSKEHLYKMRHSMAHIMAAAISDIWPEVKLGVGPVVENGFYYDVDLGKKTLSEDNFKKLEEKMGQIIAQDQEFIKSEKSIDEAIVWAKKTKQPYKLELLNDLKRAGTTAVKDLDSEELGLEGDGKSGVKSVSFYQNGDFLDLCKGPHLDSTGQAGAFKIMRTAGAYWRGNEKNPQMQRVYGVAFETEKELRKHLQMIEEAKKRDHRKLGQELDLFTISNLVGPGLPLFTPRGTVVRQELEKLSAELQSNAGYEAVWTPHMTRIELYKVSGHYEKYPERFDVNSVESDDEFMMKPMNCPHHVQIYSAKMRSYRELPVRYLENATTYRDEKSGELHGLSRVRAISMDDGHVFCREDQIEEEMRKIMSMIGDLYGVLGLDWYARLSFRDDSDKYLGDKKLWDKAQKVLKKVADDLELKYEIEEGDAAFYGPKIDVMVKDGLGREWQCATEQLDFVQPERFKLEYTAEDGSKKRPVMIHKALLGSVERFMSVYIEHTAGKFPIWLAPEQVRLVTVNQEEPTVKLATEIKEKAQQWGVRLKIDNSSESVGKKIRTSEVWKVPYTMVIGEKEIESGKVVPRVRKDLEVNTHSELSIDNFLKTVSNEAKTRVSKSSI